MQPQLALFATMASPPSGWAPENSPDSIPVTSVVSRAACQISGLSVEMRSTLELTKRMCLQGPPRLAKSGQVHEGHRDTSTLYTLPTAPCGRKGEEPPSLEAAAARNAEPPPPPLAYHDGEKLGGTPWLVGAPEDLPVYQQDAVAAARDGSPAQPLQDLLGDTRSVLDRAPRPVLPPLPCPAPLGRLLDLRATGVLPRVGGSGTGQWGRRAGHCGLSSSRPRISSGSCGGGGRRRGSSRPRISSGSCGGGSRRRGNSGPRNSSGSCGGGGSRVRGSSGPRNSSGSRRWRGLRIGSEQSVILLVTMVADSQDVCELIFIIHYIHLIWEKVGKMSRSSSLPVLKLSGTYPFPASLLCDCSVPTAHTLGEVY